MEDGNQEFKNLINFINTNNVELPYNQKPYLANLIEKWNNKNKTTEDYFNMKNNHSYLGQYMMSPNNKELSELWDKYIGTAQIYRVKMMANAHKNNNSLIENGELVLTDDTLGVSFYSSN